MARERVAAKVQRGTPIQQRMASQRSAYAPDSVSLVVSRKEAEELLGLLSDTPVLTPELHKVWQKLGRLVGPEGNGNG